MTKELTLKFTLEEVKNILRQHAQSVGPADMKIYNTTVVFNGDGDISRFEVIMHPIEVLLAPVKS